MAEIQDQLHNHVEDEIDAYALGILEDDALAKVEAHLEGCEQCRRLLQQAREVTNLLLIAPTPVAPPASLKQRILSRLAQEGRQDGRSTPSAPDLSSTQDREAENRRPGSEREGRSVYEPDPTVATPLPETTSARQGWSETLRHLLTGRRGTAGGKAAGAADPAAEEHLQVVLRLLHAPNPAIWELPGTHEAPRAHARLLGSPDEDTAILLVSGLEPLPPDRDYQLWFLRENQPVGSAVFDVHRNGEGQLVIHAPRQLAHYDLAAITPEPAGGSPGPTGPIVIAGALKAA